LNFASQLLERAKEVSLILEKVYERARSKIQGLISLT
jgi:hypothetical protein